MSTIWHFRLGHPSLNKMLPLKSVLPSFSGECTETYTICRLAKQQRLSFPFINNMCSSTFV